MTKFKAVLKKEECLLESDKKDLPKSSYFEDQLKYHYRAAYKRQKHNSRRPVKTAPKRSRKLEDVPVMKANTTETIDHP